MQTNDGLVPAVDPADLKSVWAMTNEFQVRHPGQQVVISIDAYNSASKPGADVSAFCSRESHLLHKPWLIST